MEAIFVEIDADDSNEITMDEIHEFAEAKGLDPKMAKKWQELFDPEDTGKITMEQFCDVLGLNPAAIESARKERDQPKPKLNSDVQVVDCDMPIEDQVYISDKTRDLVAEMKPSDGQEVTSRLRQLLEDKYGKGWNVVVSTDSCWVKCYHLPERSFHFRLDRHCFSTWQIPV